jgi:beta-glucosidase
MKYSITLTWMTVLFLGFPTARGFCQEVEKNPLYMDHTKSFEERVDDLLSRMTLEEKMSQMMSRTPADLIRFGIPGYEWSGQAAHCCESRYGGTVTIFPHAIAQAATWNKELIYKVGTAISDESRARFNYGYPRAGLTFWAPVVEMARDPRWGRNHESYGEDPYLTSQISLAYVKGIQGDHPRYLKAIAAPKHFAANNEEWNRHNGSSDMDEQLMREYYLYPYQVLVEEGKAESMMAAYNRLNGIPCAGNKMLLTDILRGNWGFDGSVVTDCNGIKDLFDGHKYVDTVQEAIALALNAGIDMECGDYFKKHLAEVVERGLVSEKTINTAVRRLLLSRFRLGLYDPPELVPYNHIPHSIIDGPAHRALARETARQAIILLKNTDNILPLDKNKIKSIAVIGPGANVCEMGGYTGKYSIAVSPLDGIKNKIDSSKVRFVKGTGVKITLPIIPGKYLVPPDAKSGEQGLLGEYFNNTDCSDDPVFSRIDSVIDFDYSRGSPDPQIQNDYFSVRWTGQFIAPISGPYYIGGAFDDAIRFYFDNELIIDKTLNRNQNSEAVKVELEKGTHYDLRIDFTEHWYKSKMKLWGAPQDPEKFREAKEAARDADVAIVVIGTDETVEKEGVDRSSLELPGDQNDLIKAVYKSNPKTIVVMQNGSALAINWTNDNIPAILETFYNGEEGGNALADVVFGDYNPAGRLPLTFYKSDDQLPSISDYDIRKGRTYMYPLRNFVNHASQKEEPLYPFGHGLSYTEFSYGPLKISSDSIDPDGSLTISIIVKNSGKRVGDEVVQLYVRDEEASVARPLKQLLGFERISLAPNESKSVRFVLQSKDLSFWNVSKKTFIVEPGLFEVMIGSSSVDIKSRFRFRIN